MPLSCASCPRASGKDDPLVNVRYCQAQRPQLHLPLWRAEAVSPLVRRIVARNPGPFTFLGTGTYVIGRGKVAVIDPGPELAEHVDVLVQALAGESVTHILITHTHI